jgi:class 3 adenylate cyclase
MIAPDVDPTPDDRPAPPEALVAGQRTLAAIVFTDTVGFSSLMSKNEERTMGMIARDLDHMKAVCGAFGGQVMKSTGDGLMMLFTSAVQAVACALEIQRDFHKQNLERPKAEQLQHRIGIHLGDVFQNSGDVMGDGVNIAARLEAEAIPGGICLSKTVYDVVNNRLAFYVNDLGPRKLKNIGTITAYQISPTNRGPNYLGLMRRGMRTAGALAVTVALIVVLYYAVYHTATTRQKRADDALTKLAHELDPHGLAPTASGDQVPAAGETAPPANFVPEKGKIQATDEEFEIARFNFMTRYNFNAMIDWLEKYDAPSTDETKLAEICKALRALFGWSTIELQNYSEARPLVMHNDADGHPHVCWPNISGGLMLRAGDGAPIALPRDQVPPATYADIEAALIRENAKTDTPATLQLWRGVRFFVEIYHVKPSPALQKDLDDAAAQDYASTAPAN